MVGLDESVYKLRSGLSFSGATRPFKFDTWIAEDHFPLTHLNHAYGSVKREALFNSVSKWYEIRVLKDSTWWEIAYMAEAKDDEHYDLDGMRRRATDKEFILQSPPIP